MPSRPNIISHNTALNAALTKAWKTSVQMAQTVAQPDYSGRKVGVWWELAVQNLQEDMYQTWGEECKKKPTSWRAPVSTHSGKM